MKMAVYAYSRGTRDNILIKAPANEDGLALLYRAAWQKAVQGWVPSFCIFGWDEELRKVLFIRFPSEENFAPQTNPVDLESLPESRSFPEQEAVIQGVMAASPTIIRVADYLLADNTVRITRNNDADTVMTAEKHLLRCTWENIGEGLHGDYDPNDPNDVNLLRFYASMWDAAGACWMELDDASYCTQMPANTDPAVLERALRLIINRYDDAIGNLDYGFAPSVKKIGEELSWMSPCDFEEKPPQQKTAPKRQAYLALVKSSALRDTQCAKTEDADPLDDDQWFDIRMDGYVGVYFEPDADAARARAAAFAGTAPECIRIVPLGDVLTREYADLIRQWLLDGSVRMKTVETLDKNVFIAEISTNGHMEPDRFHVGLPASRMPGPMAVADYIADAIAAEVTKGAVQIIS